MPGLTNKAFSITLASSPDVFRAGAGFARTGVITDDASSRMLRMFWGQVPVCPVR